MAPGKVDATDKKSPPEDDGAIFDEDLLCSQSLSATERLLMLEDGFDAFYR
jgi:hypothetical protein